MEEDSEGPPSEGPTELLVFLLESFTLAKPSLAVELLHEDLSVTFL